MEGGGECVAVILCNDACSAVSEGAASPKGTLPSRWRRGASAVTAPRASAAAATALAVHGGRAPTGASGDGRREEDAETHHVYGLFWYNYSNRLGVNYFIKRT